MEEERGDLNRDDREVALEEVDVERREVPLRRRDVRSIYLITYSQANLDLVPTREEFSRIVIDGFEKSEPASRSRVIQWVCSQEQHTTGGIHYHMAVKLNFQRRWLKVRNYLDQNHNVKVNFSSRHNNYYSAWHYTTKEDPSYLQSENHPDLANALEPATARASTARRAGATKDNNNTGSKRSHKSLTVFDVSQLAVEKGIKTRLELVALANRQKKEGKIDLAKFIANSGSKAVAEALSVGWEMEEAESKLERSNLTRIEILYKHQGEECAVGCNGRWLTMAEDVLSRNGITSADFAEAIRTLLQKGRGKYRNIFIKGPANCGKTFILNPLNKVYTTFTNPATTTFAWVEAESAEAVFLNDFRWSRQIIPWHDLLLLLEGQRVHLPAPKTHYTRDIAFTKDTPIFCTGKEELSLVRGGVLDETETEMMRVRWRVFFFHCQIPESEQISVPSCPRCFAKLVFCQP